MVIGYLKEKWNQWKAEKERARREAQEAAVQIIWAVYYESKTMVDVSRMTGLQFEQFLARLFLRMGYLEVTLTAANDQGGDVLCVAPGGTPVVVQAKRWKGKVGNDAVQELLGAMRHYGRSRGMVVTNSTFTPAAVRLATICADVTLCDGRWLEQQINKFLPPEVPAFSRETFDGIIRELSNFTRESARTAPAQFRRRRGRQDYTFLGLLKRMAEAKGKELSPEEIMEVAHHYNEITQAQARLLEAGRSARTVSVH